MSTNEKDDWNAVDSDEDKTPILSDDEDDDDQGDVDLTPTPKEETELKSAGPVGAIIRNVPASCHKDELRQYLSDFKFSIARINPKYEENTIDYTLIIHDQDPSINDKIMKFSANIHGKNVSMDLADLPRNGGRRGGRGYRDGGNGRGNNGHHGGGYRDGGGYHDGGGHRGGNRSRNYDNDNSRRQGGFIRTNSPKQRSGNSNDFRTLRNSTFNRSDNQSGFQSSRPYKNKSSNTLSQSQYSSTRAYKSNNSPDINTQSPRTPSDFPKLAVLSITPEKSKLENLPKKDFDTTEEVRDQSIFGSGKPRDDFIVSPIDLHSGSSTPNERGFYQDITPSPIVPFTPPKNNNPKPKKQNKKQPDQQNQKNKNQNKNANKNQKSNVKQNPFGALDDDDEDHGDSNGSDNE